MQTFYSSDRTALSIKKRYHKIKTKKLLPNHERYDKILFVDGQLNSSSKYARVAQLVEHDLAKVGAAGSSPVSRSFLFAEAFVFKSFRYFYIKITQVEFVVVLTDI